MYNVVVRRPTWHHMVKISPENHLHRAVSPNNSGNMAARDFYIVSIDRSRQTTLE